MDGSPRAHATLAGGCFWCLEAVFERVRGVESVVSGYAGGQAENPSYHDVCGGATGHAEVVQVTFDPATLGYRDVLEIFFTTHDPTTVNRQGHDVGTQYRSAIFTADAGQAEVAQGLIQALTSDQVFPDPIVTEISPLTQFWPADANHQQYYRRNPAQNYCAAVIAPKVAALRRRWASKLRDADTPPPTAP